MQVEAVLASKADTADMERRALKNEVDAGFRTQMSDLHSLLRTKADDAEFKVCVQKTYQGWGVESVCGLRALIWHSW